MPPHKFERKKKTHRWMGNFLALRAVVWGSLQTDTLRLHTGFTLTSFLDN